MPLLVVCCLCSSLCSRCEQAHGFLNIGSLAAKVKPKREAFKVKRKREQLVCDRMKEKEEKKIEKNYSNVSKETIDSLRKDSCYFRHHIRSQSEDDKRKQFFFFRFHRPRRPRRRHFISYELAVAIVSICLLYFEPVVLADYEMWVCAYEWEWDLDWVSKCERTYSALGLFRSDGVSVKMFCMHNRLEIIEKNEFVNSVIESVLSGCYQYQRLKDIVRCSSSVLWALVTKVVV